MATFYNHATLSFGGNVVNSNTTEAEVISGLTLTKTAVSSSYSAGSGIVYVITLANMGNTAFDDITITDNLGAYTTVPGGTTVVPLTYVDGSILYYINGQSQPAPTVTANGELQISGINLPANSTATFIYEATANEFAPIAVGSTIINTARVSDGACSDDAVASATIGVSAEPLLTIAKAVSPAVLTDSCRVTYTIIVQNLGNVPVNATDGVIISDVFNPVLSDIAVTLNDAPLAEGTGYTYNETTGEFATVDGVITVPAATYTQDPVTGVITTTPGVTVLTVSGTL